MERIIKTLERNVPPGPPVERILVHPGSIAGGLSRFGRLAKAPSPMPKNAVKSSAIEKKQP